MAKLPQLTKDEIEKMRKACRLAANTLVYIEKYVKPGVSLNEIDQLVLDYTLTHGAKAAPLGYHGFPKAVCTSVNEVVCHGVPDDSRLKEGDIINVDVTPVLDGFYGDSSKTFLVGKVSDRSRAITEAAFEAMWKGIEAITPMGTTGDIGFAIDKYVTRKGYTTVKEIGGHGIGKKFHDEPFVPSFGKKGKGDPLIPWRCITVEPMINESEKDIEEFDIPNSTIKWYRTSDRSLSAQFEHTVLVTDTGYEVLTVPD